MENAWYNFRTKEYEYLKDAPEDYSDYVPYPAGRALYRIYVEHEGMKPAEAAIKVLSTAIGDEMTSKGLKLEDPSG